MATGGDSYLAAGVDSRALEALKERIKAFSSITQKGALPGAGRGFAGIYPLTGFKEPVLVASTDGVGTKLKIASLLGHWESLGADLVNLNINDVLTWGARPLFFLDYLAMGRLDVQALETLVRGMAWACHQANCALIGGETAQMPGVYTGDDMDMAGFLVGAVEKDEMLDSSTIAQGDAIVGIPSSGLHTNGFSLVRRVFGIDETPNVLYHRYTELGHTLGEQLLITHRSYFPLLEPALPLVKGMSHITGGGLPGKLPLILPADLAAKLEPRAWEVPAIFGLIQRTGNVATDEMYRVFNMGVGMALVCAPEKVATLTATVPEARVIGEVVGQEGDSRLILDDE